MCSIVSKLAEIREMDAEQIQEEAQLLYDNINWRGNRTGEREMMDAYRSNYRQLTGNNLKVEYNCPA